MGYEVTIRKNDTGEVRRYAMDFDWDKDEGQTDLFWWTDGNFGCDCNRGSSFLRAGGPGPADDPHWNNVEFDCGHEGYTVLHAYLPDGRVIPIDAPADQSTGDT
jgi:hypothetical protein